MLRREKFLRIGCLPGAFLSNLDLIRLNLGLTNFSLSLSLSLFLFFPV